MDWSHLEMPFVLSLFPSFLCYFHFTSPLFVVGRRCVFLLFLPSLVSFREGRRKGNLFFYFGYEQPRMKIDHEAGDK